jgi:dTDP-glucose 4,6-dehydratase
LKTLLVIGGTGFFGKSVLDLFRRGGLAPWGIGRVIAMSRSAARLRDQHPDLVSGAVSLLDADIGTVENLPAADFVIHAAATTDASRYLSRPLEERRNIQAGTLNYCRIAPRCHATARIVYASSGAVYGPLPADLPNVPESFDAAPLDDMPDTKRDYAFAKRDAEESIRQLGRDGHNVSIARCFAFVGPWLPRDQHFAIGNFIADGLSGRPIRVKATSRVYRSYMHADDLIEWLLTIAARANPATSVYNVGSDAGILMGELAKRVAQAFGVEAQVPEIIDARVDRYVPETGLARRELGLTLRHDLDSAIRSTIDAIRQRGG